MINPVFNQEYSARKYFAIPNGLAEHPPQELHVPVHRLWTPPPFRQFTSQRFQEGRSNRVESCSWQQVQPGFFVAPFIPLRSAREGHQVLLQHLCQLCIPTDLIPLREEPAFLLFQLGLLVKLPCLRLGGETPEPPFPAVVIEPYIPDWLAGRVRLTQQAPSFLPARAIAYLPFRLML